MADNVVHITLNPEDVLAHLRELGFQHTTPERLQEFMHDLKKVIKHDLRKNQNVRCKFHVGQKVPVSTENQLPEGREARRKPLSSKNVFPSQDNDSSGNKSTSTNPCSSRSEVSSSSPSTEEHSSRQENVAQKNKTKKQPRPSFIRPRDIGPVKAPPRSDPVALYHYYQKFWQTFKLPGEDEHRDLRWSIRERMLGPSQQTKVSVHTKVTTQLR